MTYPIGVRLAGLADRNDIEGIEQWLQWLKKTGFQVVDVLNLTPEVKQAVERSGLAIGSFDVDQVPLLFSRDEAERAGAVEHVKKQIGEAAALGEKICFVCLKPKDNAMPRQESLAIFKETFPAITAEAEKHDVKLVMEGYPGPEPFYPTLGCTPETLRAMFEAVPSPSLCVNYDPSHLVRLGIDYLRFLREFSDRVAHVHAKDCKILDENVYLYGRHQKAAFDQPVKFSEGPWRYTIPGEGEVDWASVAFELEQSGYDGAVSIELEDYRYSESPEAQRRGLKNTLDHLRKYFS